MQEQAAEKVIDPKYQLKEVDIVLVAAKESPIIWNIQDLIDSDYGGCFESGLLEVRFKDIPTCVDFDGYIIEAKSVNLADENVADYKSPSVIARPRIVGGTVAEVLNLVPGAKYYVTVYAVMNNVVRISPKQDCSEYNTATTLLSAPLLDSNKIDLVDPACVDSIANTDNNLRRNCFQFMVHDDNGNTVARETVDIDGSYLYATRSFFQSVFANQREGLTLSVSQGHMFDQKYRAVSDTASVKVKLPMYPLSQMNGQFW